LNEREENLGEIGGKQTSGKGKKLSLDGGRQPEREGHRQLLDHERDGRGLGEGKKRFSKKEGQEIN